MSMKTKFKSKRIHKSFYLSEFYKYLIIILFCFTIANTSTAQPSGGPYGPVHKSYELPKVTGTIYYVAPDGDAKTSSNNGTIDLSSVFSIPGGVKAVYITGVLRCATAGTYVYFGTPGGSSNHCEVHTQVSNVWMPFGHMIPCDSNGDINVTFQSGYTFDVYLRISGYDI